MNTKAVVFDAYGTLFDVNSAAEKCKSKIGNEWEAFANFLENHSAWIHLVKKLNEKT